MANISRVGTLKLCNLPTTFSCDPVTCNLPVTLWEGYTRTLKLFNVVRTFSQGYMVTLKLFDVPRTFLEAYGKTFRKQ